MRTAPNRSGVMQDFPLALVGISITSWAIQVLRAGKLNKLASKRSSVSDVTNDFYAGTFFTFHKRWVAGKCTMLEHSATVMARLEASAKSNCSRMVNAAASN